MGTFEKIIVFCACQAIWRLNSVLILKGDLKIVKSIRKFGIRIDGSGSIVSRFLVC